MSRSRTRQIVFRVTDEEMELIKKKVAQSGLSQQQYIIQSLTRQTVTNTDGIKELMPELKRIGNNLNQLAKAYNSRGCLEKIMVMSNQKELENIWQQLKQYLQKLA